MRWGKKKKERRLRVFLSRAGGKIKRRTGAGKREATVTIPCLVIALMKKEKKKGGRPA